MCSRPSRPPSSECATLRAFFGAALLAAGCRIASRSTSGAGRCTRRTTKSTRGPISRSATCGAVASALFCSLTAYCRIRTMRREPALPPSAAPHPSGEAEKAITRSSASGAIASAGLPPNQSSRKARSSLSSTTFSHPSPLNCSSGFASLEAPPPAPLAKPAIAALASTPNSYMSRMRWSKQRPRTRLCGLFFECVPNPKSDASFFWQRNSSGVASSHGWTALCRRKCFACGFFRQKRSVSNSLTTADDFWPRASSAVRGFSTSLGSRCARKRRPRADFARLLSRLM
mmetsp:Transcript_13430/g.43001  ORF Transcript_13430/g.43001 Transcript_13430/m.43001 type:complete len:287 (-) Transcript_13430:42-902(-)